MLPVITGWFLPEKHHKSLFFSPCQVFSTTYFHPVMRTRELYIPKQAFQLKTSLDHLPNHKRYEINGIMLSIKELVNPEMIILFGSYSRGDWVDERYYDENRTLHEYKSDYDFLVVTEHHQDMPPGLGKRIRQRVKRQERLQASPHIIFHDINFLNKELEEGYYFFRDLILEETLLYTAGKYELIIPKELFHYLRGKKIKLYFNQWMEKEDDLRKYYNLGLRKENLIPLSFNPTRPQKATT